MINEKELKKIVWLSEEEYVVNEDYKYYINKFMITYFNDVEEEIHIYENKETAYRLLEEVDFHKVVLESLGRFAEDSEVNSDVWDKLYDKVFNEEELSEEELKNIAICINICTVFDCFNYKEYREYRKNKKNNK